MLVVADSSAFIALATCEGLDLILHVFDDIRVPKAVYQEVIVEGKSQSAALELFLSEHVVEVDITHWVLAAGGLGRGELEAMALYKQLSADALIIDDHRARTIAEHNRIKCIGALGILLLAKQRGRVDRILPHIEKLRLFPIRYADELLNRVLELAGE